MDDSAPTAPLPKAPARPFRWPRRLVIGLACMALALGVVASAVRYVLLVKARNRTAEVIARLDRDDPGWHSGQIEAGRKVLADSENSAIPLLAAKRLLPPGWPATGVSRTSQGPASEAEEAERARLVLPLLDKDAPDRPDEEQIAALRAELLALAPAMAEARKVANLPEGRYVVAWAVDPLATLLPHVQDVRAMANLLKLDAILRAHDGDADGAIECCRAILNVGRSLGDEPILISQLVRVSIVRSSIECLESVLARGEPSDEALASMQRLLEVEEAQSMLRAELRGERAFLDDFYARNASGRINNLAPPTALNWLYGEAMITHARGVVLEEMTEALAIADAPLSGQHQRIESWTRNLATRSASGGLDQFSRLLLPAIAPAIDSHVTSRARLRAAIVAVAAERYRRKGGRWPESAGPLTPWPLAKAPADPCTDAPLIWLRSGGTLLIYSTGLDLDDNRGDLEHEVHPVPGPASRPGPSKPAGADKDIGFRLHDAARRDN